MVPPIPAYLLVSVGARFNKGSCAPEQNKKKDRKRCITQTLEW